MDVLTYARYILETALLEYKFNVAVSESKLAAAALVLAFKVRAHHIFSRILFEFLFCYIGTLLSILILKRKSIYKRSKKTTNFME
jgi:hypothetical protein